VTDRRVDGDQLQGIVGHSPSIPGAATLLLDRHCRDPVETVERR
jgi:hypothetical protein